MIWLWVAARLARLGRGSSAAPSASARGSATPSVPDDLFGALMILALVCLLVMLMAIAAVIWALVAGGRFLLGVRRREPEIEGSIW